MVKKEKIELGTPRYGYLMIEGEYYKLDTDRTDGRYLLEKQDKDKIEKKIKKCKSLAKKLKDSLDSEKILMESLMKLEEDNLKILENMLTQTDINYKPKTREHNCVDMKIGNFVIPIVD